MFFSTKFCYVVVGNKNIGGCQIVETFCLFTELKKAEDYKKNLELDTHLLLDKVIILNILPSGKLRMNSSMMPDEILKNYIFRAEFEYVIIGGYYEDGYDYSSIRLATNINEVNKILLEMIDNKDGKYKKYEIPNYDYALYSLINYDGMIDKDSYNII
jgi:hypothetical protein